VISVDIAGHRFQLRAAAVVAHDGFVLLHRLEGDQFWALPGGRVEPGEDARSTLEREMVEELGEHVACAELLYLVENFFEHAGKSNHEIGLYFRVRLDPMSGVLDKSRSHAGVEGDKRLEFRWFLMEQLHEVDLRPSFLRRSLSGPTIGFQHIVQRE
jgi:8-oxo-dGTP pyrophosphatase MutT (NUDIX family)